MASSKDEEQQQKWEGKAKAKLNGLRADQVWPLLEDFCNFHKWLPTIDTCHQVEGINGQPDLVRYCASSSSSTVKMIKWGHEKLIAIDPVLRCLTYEILDNNLGFKSYMSTIRVLPAAAANLDGGGDDDDGCEIVWSFLADPVDGLTYEGLASYINYSLLGMAENMEKALGSN